MRTFLLAAALIVIAGVTVTVAAVVIHDRTADDPCRSLTDYAERVSCYGPPWNRH